MTKKSIYILLLCGVLTQLHSQDYFSKIIPTTDNPLIKILNKVNDKYVMPTDFFSASGLKGGLLLLENNEIDRYKFEKLDLGASPIAIIDDGLILAGENPLSDGDSLVQLIKINTEDFSIDWCKEFNVEAPRTFNTDIVLSGNMLFTLNVNNISETETVPRKLFIMGVNTNGEKIWSKKINSHARLTLGWKMITSGDQNLIISASINYYDKIGRYSQLLKLNTEGEILWNYEGTEELANGAVPTWVTELSDGTILQTYYVDRRNDVDFISNNWYKEPNKFIWVSADGEWLRDKYIITEFEDRIFFDGVESGQGDYFFGYGYVDELNSESGFSYSCYLTKYTNDGDTIWSRKYKHPLYPDNNILHNIRDLIEEENGDLTILADITPPGAKTEVWLFRVDSEGCYVNSECTDMSVPTSVSEVEDFEAKVHPNPTTGIIEVTAPKVMVEIRVFDITGQPVRRIQPNSRKVNIDMHPLQHGIYLLQIKDIDGKVETVKVIKV